MEIWKIVSDSGGIPFTIECDKAFFDEDSVSFCIKIKDGSLGCDIPGYITIARFRGYHFATKEGEIKWPS